MLALQLLYQIDLLGSGISEREREEFLQRATRDEVARRFARELVHGVLRHQAEIDARLAALAQNWQLGRMAVVDRNVLRIGAYELLYTDAPPKVVINEAVELAKRFSGKNSGAFVNGILDSLLKSVLARREAT
ncbi:MAG: N utilization substance protein B [Planctomycetota bacterium]|nr:MAG: N utilization substance protein B [Planctomycetota bacterium]